MQSTDTAVRLSKTYDVDRLLADLRACERVQSEWLSHKMVARGTSVGRKMLQLRTRGGHLAEIDTNDNQVDHYRDTKLLAHAPYVREILDGLEINASSVLFLALEAGGKIKEHADGPTWALGAGYEIRLHLPIVTNEDVWYVVGGQRHDPRPGELWYGDFSQPHWFENRGSETRVYLMINTRVSDTLLRLFPEAYLVGRDVKAEPAVCETDPELRRLRGFSCQFGGITPELEPLVAGLPPEFQTIVRATFGERNEVRWIDNQLWAIIQGRPTYLLEAVGPSRFRIAQQYATLDVEMANGVPSKATLEAYVRGHLFKLPLAVQALP
jgi:hypothetical protein